MPVGFDVGEAAEGGDEAVELVEPAGALAVGGEVDGAAVDAGFDAVLGVGDEGNSRRRRPMKGYATRAI
ncbi:MAG: hypothetical protein HKP36_19655 [Myxococcales bacterium]|nr:hypothetical protein [Deltaproteobacteria bacterium]NNK09045.1 hypothetical protein [Myxococcales bacterium]NNK44227.1 hypothetical protein [Myxococcales bacterium]NNL26653.1 hypothetical protein [Myxococcales bacterium]